jgi:pseudouridine synthase
MEQRLQKVLAAAGFASRRKAEELIAAGRVRVDGEVITQPGTTVDPDRQKVTLDGQPVKVARQRHYVALNKPAGYVSTVSDPHAPQKVTDLVQIPGARLVPVGRLDADSEGLILLSDDGDFVYKVTHPSQSLGKTYIVTVQGTPDEDALGRLSRGLMLAGEKRPTAPAGVKMLAKGREKGTSVLEVMLHEGRNRQIRRMMETVGHPVLRLVRTRVGPIEIGRLQTGEWRSLTADEVRAVMEHGRKPTGAASNKSPSKAPARPGPQTGPGRPNTHGGRPGGTGANGPSKRTTERTHETGNRSHPRPGPGQDHGKPAPGRVQVHQDRLHGRVPPRGQRDPADRRGGEGRGQGPWDHRRGQ